MKLSAFRFKLPQELIAQYPADNRDESRLMLINRKTGQIEHKIFKDFLNYFDDKDVIIFNDTRVFPARLFGNKEKTTAKIEVFLLRELNPELRLWDVVVDPARKIRIGNKLYFGPDESTVSEVIDNTTSRGRTLRFLFDGPLVEFKAILHSLGEMPLPDYITRPAASEDHVRYQTIYAKNEGAVMAPAAGFHFSRELMKRLEIKGCNFAFITNHCGLGNLRDIDVEDITKHKMDSEQVIISQEAADIVNKAKEGRRRICAVGTSVLRSVESTVTSGGYLTEYNGWSNKFIYPPYDFALITQLVTNFHMPSAPMLMQSTAFGGFDLVMKAYALAIEQGYRFGAYGDAMLII
jgi:S-adenosylmethionine:tRNA ribosyltransferase-isomerase